MSVISSLLFSFPVFYFIIFYFARINPYICGMIILLSIPKHLMKQKFPKRHSGICALMAGTALLAACHSSSESRHETGRVDAASTTHRPTGTINVTATSQAGVSSPVVYIYKMKKDYSKLVPVLMNEERTRIVSYPDPVDRQACLADSARRGLLVGQPGDWPHRGFPLLYLRGIYPAGRTSQSRGDDGTHRGQIPAHGDTRLRPPCRLQGYRDGTERKNTA